MSIALISDFIVEGDEWIEFELTDVVGAAVVAPYHGGTDFVVIDDKDDDPANDDFANAEVLSGTSGSVTVALGHSGREAGDLGDAYSVWYRWTAPSDGLLYLQDPDESISWDTRVFTGDALASVSEQEPRSRGIGGFSGQHIIPVRAGTTYHIAAKSGFHDGGQFAGPDPVKLNYSLKTESVARFSSHRFVMNETARSLTLPITRFGDLSATLEVAIETNEWFSPEDQFFWGAGYNSPLEPRRNPYSLFRQAKTGRDFRMPLASIVFAPGESQKEIVIPISKDGVKEGAEFFSIFLGSFDWAAVAITESGIFKPATYYGAVKNADELFAHSGVFSLKLSGSGAFTGKVRFGSESAAFKGEFVNGDDEVTLALPQFTLILRAPKATGSLYSSYSTTPNVITGTVSGGNVTSNIDAYRVFQRDRFYRYPDAGAFRIAMTPSAVPVLAPNAPGIATFDISKKGTGTIKGTLADGTKFSASAPTIFHGISTEIFDFSATLYGATGGVSGRITNLYRSVGFTQAAFGDGDGSFAWHSPAPFDTTLGAMISTAQSLPAGEYECRIGTHLIRTITVGEKNALTYTAGAEALKLRLDKTGALTGSFLLGGKRALIHGISLPSVRRCSGFYLSADEVGKVEFDAN